MNEFRRETLAVSRTIFADLKLQIEALRSFPATNLETEEKKKIAKWCEHRYQEMASRASEIADRISIVGIHIEKYGTPKYPDLRQVNAQMERLRRAIELFAKYTD
jgi:hypothetical protein